MRHEDASRADKLEEALKATTTWGQRREVFAELCGLYAEDLHADAIKWAYARQSSEPTSDGPAALARAFILLAQKLGDLDLKNTTLLYLFKGKIWSELSHIKAQRSRRAERQQSIEDDLELPADSGDRIEEDLSSKDLLRQSWQLVKTSAERRLLRAGELKAEGFSWEETTQALGWAGTPESLRVSFYKLKKLIRERLSRVDSR